MPRGITLGLQEGLPDRAGNHGPDFNSGAEKATSLQ
jgi:hypothetical protein